METGVAKTWGILPENQFSVDYRYFIFHRKSKRRILLKGFDLIIKAISQQFLCPDTYGIIAKLSKKSNYRLFRKFAHSKFN